MVHMPPTDDVAGVPDVASGHGARDHRRMRRGTEATWQGRRWPPRGAIEPRSRRFWCGIGADSSPIDRQAIDEARAS